MPRNGAGTFNLVNNTWFPAVNGVLATSTDWSAFISDIASAMTQSVSSDGQTQFTGNLPMGNNKITGLANGTAATDAAAFGQVVQSFGQCLLLKSGLNIVLIPYNGNKLFINGVVCSIAAAGVSLAPGALLVGTSYYVYAVATGTVVTSLEASTTAPATDTTYGNRIKTGDATRVLVGQVRTIAGPNFADTVTQRFVLSWFNQKPINLGAVLGANQGNAGTSYSVLLAGLLLEFLTWGGGQVTGEFQGALINNVANAVSSTSIWADATASDSFSSTGAYISNAVQPVAATYKSTGLAEGYHTLQVYAKQDVVSTATYLGSGTPGTRCVHSATIQG